MLCAISIKRIKNSIRKIIKIIALLVDTDTTTKRETITKRGTTKRGTTKRGIKFAKR